MNGFVNGCSIEAPVLFFHALWDVCLPFRAFLVSGSGMRTWLCCLFGSALAWLPAFTPSIPYVGNEWWQLVSVLVG
jgi:hypothetical protein